MPITKKDHTHSEKYFKMREQKHKNCFLYFSMKNKIKKNKHGLGI